MVAQWRDEKNSVPAADVCDEVEVRSGDASFDNTTSSNRGDINDDAKQCSAGEKAAGGGSEGQHDSMTCTMT